MEPSQSLTSSKRWPPERGWPLFGALVGGIVVTILLNAFLPQTLTGPGKIWPFGLVMMVYGLPRFIR
jgi:hypothetical protein